MATPSLDLAMHIRTDLDQAVKDVDALISAMADVKGAGQNAAQGLNAAAGAASKNSSAAQANATASKSAATAQAALANATQTAAAVQKRAGISAAQHAMAMRQLPMQITDIVTGLASGQSVWMVAIQQGGQLKDSFGGVAPAARALLGAINPLTIGVTAGAAAFGAIGVAMYQGYQESRAFERATIATGYAAGVTAGQLSEVANSVGEATGKFGDADNALLQLAESGKFSGETLSAATQAAVNLSTLTGDSIEDSTAKIIKLADAPGKMLAELNQQYHFLSATVYAHVRALEEQGRGEDAARVAVEEFGRVHEERVKEAEARAGLLESTWKALGKTISSIWSSMKDVGRTDAEYRLQAAKQALSDASMRASARGMPFNPSRYQAEIDAAEKVVEAERRAALIRSGLQKAEDHEIKASEESRKQAGKDREAAEHSWDQRAIGDLDKKAKLEEKIKQIRREGALLKKSDAEIETQISQARARYAESLAGGRKRGDKSDAQKAEEAAQREIENLIKQAAMLGLVADGERRVSFEAQARYEIEQGAFRISSAKVQQELIAAAKAADVAQKKREETEKQARAEEDAQRAYERLRNELQTPVEAAISDVTKQIELLNDRLFKGKIDAAEYNMQLAKLGQQALTPLPDFKGELYQYGIGDPEAGRMEDMHSQLQSGYDLRKQIINTALAQENADKERWRKQDEELEEQHQAALSNLAIAENQMRLTQISGAFGSMAQIAKAFGGEQSKTYQAMFALSKGFAVAQAAVALAQNVAEASKLGWPANIPAIAAALAQGAQIAQLLSGANFSPGGYATGGYTGPGGKYEPAGIVHRGEGVLSQEDIRALGGPGGFHALRSAIHNGFAEGGMVMPTARAEPFGRMAEPGGAQGTTVANRMRVYVLNNEDQLAERLANHPRMEKAVVAIAGQNGKAISANW